MTEPVIFLDGRVRLYRGDCREILPTLGLFDTAIVDPPYGQTSLGWDRRVSGWPSLIRDHLTLSGSMWVFGTQRMFLECADEFSGWSFSHDVVWEKHNGAGFLNDRFRGVHEHVLHFYRADAAWETVYKQPQFTHDATPRTVRRKAKPAHWTNLHGARGAAHYVSQDGGPRLMRSVIYARSEHGVAEHPTQKPQDIIEPLLMYACPPGGIVLDPMMGAGSVGVCARRKGFGFVGIEGRDDYFDIACRRVEEATKQPDMFVERPPEPKQEAMEL
jgi:site-specific DNA-methyltransferase (adenine-specific)